MEKISFRIEGFEGPLDVLLTLINRHKLDIFNIEISELLAQYLDFMEKCRENNLELAGEFLEMAARLIYIKTALLLPQPETAEEMKKELQGSLIEYSLCKSAAASLALSYTDGIFSRSPMKIKADMTYRLTHSPEKLLEAWNNISYRKALTGKQEVKIEDKINSVVKRRIVSVISKVVHVLRELYSTGETDMDSLYTGITDRSARVATFLAVLELTRSGRIFISEDNKKIFIKDGEKNWKSKRKQP
ncbi:MAG: segregation/condensation protein A [Prevotella sp.]|nr:segregation/condensation protein A [Alistipes senegalensis]MCM1357768.1 segregation/condensation protein A [Prevotella sp.]MCM1474579.1 segregation/condensation protein A [Muribaculaceae bacterium]